MKRTCFRRSDFIAVFMAALIFISIFVPALGAAASRGRQSDEVVDENGNRHMIYSQGGDVYYKNNIGCPSWPPWARWNEPVRLTDTQMPAFHGAQAGVESHILVGVLEIAVGK